MQAHCKHLVHCDSQAHCAGASCIMASSSHNPILSKPCCGICPANTRGSCSSSAMQFHKRNTHASAQARAHRAQCMHQALCQPDDASTLKIRECTSTATLCNTHSCLLLPHISHTVLTQESVQTCSSPLEPTIQLLVHVDSQSLEEPSRPGQAIHCNQAQSADAHAYIM